MAFRTWAKLLGVTLGVAALAGACQLGLAYGLGILRLTRVLDLSVRDQWTAQLTWVAWFAMTAAVVGGMTARRLAPRSRITASAGTFAALALVAGLGAALVVPLTMQPARTAEIVGVNPVFVIGVCAALGAVVGIFAAYAALTHAVARWSLTTMGVAIWVLALTSVAPSLTPGDPLPSVRVGVLDARFLSADLSQRAALFTMPACALIAGLILGFQARRRGLPTLTIALTGLPGPALLTLSYLIAGPGAGDDRYQMVPYWAAMTATGAGVLGSVLAAVIRRGGDAEETEPDTEVITPPAAEREPAKKEPATAGSVPKKAAKAATPKPAPPPEPAPPPKPAPDAKEAGRGRMPRLPRRNKGSEPSPALENTGELPSFNAFANASEGKPSRRKRETPAGRKSETPAVRKTETPVVPKPALPEIPPEALVKQRRRAPKPVNLDATPENLRSGTPLVPEPHQLSKPLPTPQPVTPPLPVTPAPDKSRNRRSQKDEDYVDWVSQLGNE